MIPEDDFLASVERSAMVLLVVLAALTLMVATIAVVSANRLVAAPLLRIAGQLKHIEDFRLDRVSRLASPLRELDDLSGALSQMSRGLEVVPEIYADRTRPDFGLARDRGTPGWTSANADGHVHRSRRLHRHFRAAR